MPITRIKVGRGLTKRPSEEEEIWERRYFEIEAEVGPNEVPDQVKDCLETMLSKWLGESLTQPEIPEIDLGELEERPWTTYQTKERAKPGEPAWLKNPLYFKDIKDEATIELARAIERVGKLELGEYLYQFSGKEKQFISRRPLKK